MSSRAGNRAARWSILAGLLLTIVVAACGGGPMSETEYVEGFNDLTSSAGPRFEAVYAAYERIADPKLSDLVDRFEQELTIMYEVRDRFEALDPPASITEVNGIMVDILGRLIGAAEAVVEASETVSSREELEQTAQFAAYQSIDAESDSMCPAVQAEFDNLSNRAVIDDPWISDLRLSVRAYLDC